jgi:hypothetical protein
VDALTMEDFHEFVQIEDGKNKASASLLTRKKAQSKKRR